MHGKINARRKMKNYKMLMRNEFQVFLFFSHVLKYENKLYLAYPLQTHRLFN